MVGVIWGRWACEVGNGFSRDFFYFIIIIFFFFGSGPLQGNTNDQNKGHAEFYFRTWKNDEGLVH